MTATGWLNLLVSIDWDFCYIILDVTILIEVPGLDAIGSDKLVFIPGAVIGAVDYPNYGSFVF